LRNLPNLNENYFWGFSSGVRNYQFGDCFEGFKNVNGNLADQLQCDVGRVK
jgi:hypothetical protein